MQQIWCILEYYYEYNDDFCVTDGITHFFIGNFVVQKVWKPYNLVFDQLERKATELGYHYTSLGCKIRKFETW